MQQYSFRQCFAKILCFYCVFLMFLGIFYALSAPEFTLVFSIPGFLAVRFITILLPTISSYKEVTAVTAAYHDTFRAIIRLSFVFRGLLKSFSPV